MNLLSLDDIAALIAVPRPFVRDVLVKRPEFPRPCIALSQKTRRWDKAEVDQWLVKHMKHIRR